MNGMPVIINPLSSSTCLRGDLIGNVDVLFGTDGAVKTRVVYSCPLYHHKCVSVRFGICCRHLNKEEG